MLNVNGKISYDTSHADPMWPRKPELKIKKMLNRRIYRRKEELIEVIYGLSKEKLHEINNLENERENALNQKNFKVRT